MNAPNHFAASLLDSTLSAQAAGVALCLRSLPASARGPAARFEDFSADARMRLRHLTEAVAFDCPGIYLEFLAWQRASHAARGLAETLLAPALECQRRVLDEGLPPAAFATVEPFLRAGEELCAMPAAPPAPPTDDEDALRLVALLLEGRRGEALALAREVCARRGEVAFVETVLVAALAELGRLWQFGAIHVGSEHLGTRIVEEALAEVSRTGPREPDLGRGVLIATPTGDLHEIGARMVARAFERRGWEVFFLGANVPREDLVRSVAEFEPELVVLSVSSGLHARAAAEVVQGLRAGAVTPAILVGGGAFRGAPELWRRLGADATSASASEAESEGRRLVEARAARSSSGAGAGK